MAGQQIRGKGVVAVVNDIADGFLYLSPILLKKYEVETFKALYQQLKKSQKDIRSEPFPAHHTDQIRKRNVRLQRLHTALVILEHFAKQKRVALF